VEKKDREKKRWVADSQGTYDVTPRGSLERNLPRRDVKKKSEISEARRDRGEFKNKVWVLAAWYLCSKNARAGKLREPVAGRAINEKSRKGEWK